MTVVRELTADEWVLWRDVPLRSLLDSPWAFGATQPLREGAEEVTERMLLA